MFKSANKSLHVVLFSTLLVVYDVDAAEWSIESNVNSKIEYNDNIFLTRLDHESVTGLIVTPSMKMRTRDENWETALDARLRSNNYSDSNIDSNDVYLDLTGSYSTERTTYSLNGNLDFDTNLNSQADDFGVVPLLIKREIRRITPQFTRMINERLSFTASYSYSDVDYIDTFNRFYRPSSTNTVSGSLAYSISERNLLNFTLQGSAYESKDNTVENDVVIARIGMDHKLSESLSVNYLIGGSRRDSITQDTRFISLPGSPPGSPRVEFLVVTESNNSGFVLDAGFEQKWLTSSLTGKVSRDNTTDSFGSLNEVDIFRLLFNQKITQVWRYSVSARYEDIQSVTSANQFFDRENLFFEPIVTYALDRGWSVNASYRYARRKSVSLSNNQAPDSNRIFIGMNYNFPSLSTF